MKLVCAAFSITAILLLQITATAAFANDAPGLTSGAWTLSLTSGKAPQVFHGPDVAATVGAPLLVDIIDGEGKTSELMGQYARVEAVNGQFRATGSLTTPAGSVLDFADCYQAVADRGSFSLDRTVTVRRCIESDRGFCGEFIIRSARARQLAEVQPFVPGVWYCDAAHVPASGLISDPTQHYYLFREDRLPLPLAMIRERSSGLVVCLIHDQPDGATFPAENTAATVIDGRMRFASLGVVQQDGIGVALAYPGVEKDQSSIGRGNHRRPSGRFHPFTQGFSQHVRMIMHLSMQPGFDEAMSDCWREAYNAFAPSPVSVPLQRVYADSIDLLDHYCADHRGVMGFPFAVKLPDGAVRDVSYQMGFVGEQLPCACHLITAGFARPQADLVAKGEHIVDFWAANCLTPAGIPRTWYDVDPTPHWRDYPTFTRIATDGMEGMLQAWRRMKLNHRDKPDWLACCQKYGAWLVANQNADGSYFRQYGDDGRPLILSKSASLQPVRFLVDLWNATGDDRYLVAARRAGAFGVQDIGETTNYYGGTADNNDVKDKEAGWIAMDSFLSLYEASGDRAWLIPAARAANFTETWAYCWNVPIDRSDAGVTFPPVQTTAGMSLIAAGHSAADVFLAFAPYAYYRLSIYTGEAHFAAVARLLLQNPRQLVDIGGSLHYAQSGLLTEAFTLAPPRGHGVNVWLPWCTAAVLDPMQQFDDAFGSMDLAEIDQIPPAQREQMLRAFARRHGFP